LANSSPPLTVGLPVYNGERFLARALESILDQTFTDFELLISDNASTDRTEAICREAVRTDRRVRYVRHDVNRGGSWNFNFVALEAQSELFRFAADDDLLEPTLLERCLEAQRNDPDAVLWYPRTVEIDLAGKYVRDFSDSLELLEKRPHERLRRFLDQYETSNALFGIIRRDVLLGTRLHGSYQSADIVLFAELALRGRFVEVPDFLFKRRWEERSTGEKYSQQDTRRWYDPSSRKRYFFVRTRLFAEIARSIFEAPIPLKERILSIREFGASWIPKHGRAVLGELKRAIIMASKRRA
jgi:glycosyltransferase involved in cell wall biosynthesis